VKLYRVQLAVQLENLAKLPRKMLKVGRLELRTATAATALVLVERSRKEIGMDLVAIAIRQARYVNDETP
jgi:hypothetical protein